MQNTLKIISAKSKSTFSGHKVKLNARYKVDLQIVKPLYDLHELADFAGWISYQKGRRRWFHNFAKRFSRKRAANLFSLIAVVNGKKIDLGKLWKKANKQTFEINFKDYFNNKNDELKLFVFLNDVYGFYWNNRGSYTIELKLLKPNM